jgi:hypothetical protein
MLDTNYMADNTDNLFSLFEGSVTNEGSVATMPTLMTEMNSGMMLLTISRIGCSLTVISMTC